MGLLEGIMKVLFEILITRVFTNGAEVIIITID